MSIEITVPRLGWSMEEGSFCRWLKSDGELVREGDELFELEGDKATQVVESFDAGILRIETDGPQPGDVVKVGQVLGHLEPRSGKAGSEKPKAPTIAAKTTPANGDGVGDASRSVAPASAAPAAAAPYSPSRAATAPVAKRGAAGCIAVASPAVRRLARELGVDLKSISRSDTFPVSASELMRSLDRDAPGSATARRQGLNRPVTPRARCVARELGVDASNLVGTGRNGRIREADVREARPRDVIAPQLRSTPTTNSQVGAPISNLRRVIAQRMMAAFHETAPVTLTTRADASELVRFRTECKRTSEERGVKPPSYTELFVKLCAAALEKHPALLDQWVDGRIVKPEGIHVAVAVATPNGLVTPVIRDVPAMSLRELSSGFAELVELARSQRLTVEQMRGGAFTVSSLGGYRVEAFTPILNPPQTAILGVGQISPQSVVRDGQLAVAEVVSLSLTFDHRVVDGAPAAAFLTSVCEMIESPLGWLLA
jgi:pyruvate dehydrogenase E2 component (dihydrolipoamide acetyltransferase)